MNNVQLMGNLARDPEIRFTKNGTCVASFTVAATNESVNRETGEAKEYTAFVNCIAWNKLGEQVGNLYKGARVLVQGRLQTRSYEKDGSKRYITEVVASFVGQSLLGLQYSDSFDGSSNFDSFADSGATQQSNQGRQYQQDDIPF